MSGFRSSSCPPGPEDQYHSVSREVLRAFAHQAYYLLITDIYPHIMLNLDFVLNRFLLNAPIVIYQRLNVLPMEDDKEHQRRADWWHVHDTLCLI